MRRLLVAMTTLFTLVGAVPGAAIAASPDLVGNGSASRDLTGWSALTQSGTVTLRRITGLAGSAARTGVEVARVGGSGSWAYALAALNAPASHLVAGRAYRMSAWLRDTGGAGRTYGILLANGAYQHRPTATVEYTSPGDAGWHQVSRTFVATAPASADTAFYLALPGAGSFDLQATGVSLVAVSAPGPAHVRTGPSRVIGFSGSAVDPRVWNYDLGAGGWGNGELETYTSDPANVHVDGHGQLLITALRSGSGYTSGRLTTRGKVTVAPGSYVEAAITAPVGASVWPAFWLLGADIGTVGWPACGELDAFEGTGSEPTSAKAAAHMAVVGDPAVDKQYGWGEAGGTTDVGSPLDTRSHLFGVYFDRATVRFYLDRRPTMSLWATDAATSGRTWPFGNAQFILLDVAIAGGVDNAATTFPRTMTVGSLAVWSGGTPF
jgi:beta-glucanase (GH16 family)